MHKSQKTAFISMKISVPTSWDDISIKQFIQLNNLKKLEDNDDIDFMIELVSIMCSVPRNEVYKFPIPDLKYIYSRLSFTLSHPESKQIKLKYTQEGVTYIPVVEVQKLKAGQYIDIKEFCKTDAISNLHNLMACIYIPNGEGYNDTPVLETAKKFYEAMPITVAYPIAVFFWTLLNDSIKTIQGYSMEEVRAQMKKVSQAFK